MERERRREGASPLSRRPELPERKHRKNKQKRREGTQKNTPHPTSTYPAVAVAAPSYSVDRPRALRHPHLHPNEASAGSRFTARVRFVLGRFIPACAFVLAERLVSAVEETEAGAGSVVSSHIKASFCATLSVWTVWACWRRLSRRENCLEQRQVKGRSQVCFLQGGGVKMRHMNVVGIRIGLG